MVYKNNIFRHPPPPSTNDIIVKCEENWLDLYLCCEKMWGHKHIFFNLPYAHEYIWESKPPHCQPPYLPANTQHEHNMHTIGTFSKHQRKRRGKKTTPKKHRFDLKDTYLI